MKILFISVVVIAFLRQVDEQWMNQVPLKNGKSSSSDCFELLQNPTMP